MVSFCKDSLPQRGSSLLKIQAAVVSPHSHGEKVKLTKVFTKNCQTINKHLLTAAACRLGWVQQGKGRRKKHRSCPSEVRGHEGAVVSRGGRGGGVQAEGAARAKSSCGKACPG